MTIFLDLKQERDKEAALSSSIRALKHGQEGAQVFRVVPEEFHKVPRSPFAYWASAKLRDAFTSLEPFESSGRAARVGVATLDNFRFLRLYWEVNTQGIGRDWCPYAKGGAYSPFYDDVYLCLRWATDGGEVKAHVAAKVGSASRKVQATEFYFRPGLTWPSRTQKGFAPRVLPEGCVFDTKGNSAFIPGDDAEDILSFLAIFLGAVFRQLVNLQMSFGAYEVGVVQRTPIPKLTADHGNELSDLARRGWSLRRALDSVNETSHAFLLPAALRERVGNFDPDNIDLTLQRILSDLDSLVSRLYGLDDVSESTMSGLGDAELGFTESYEGTESDEDDHAGVDRPNDSQESLFSWCIGVAVGRFDWRLATGERVRPADPQPFDPLPAKSPAMLPDDAEPFHIQGGILVDEPGHPHDLAHLVESVLERVGVPVPPGVRQWLQRDFFPKHLKQYSKSRRKAPIYWPLATTSGSYVLWIYYPMLTGQTLYTAVNDFVEPKLKSVAQTAQSLRNKVDRSRAEEKQLEQAQDFELELADLRDTLLESAKGYKPIHDDGVQVTAAPLWPLFRHKPWQKVLKDTWKKLEKGDYDWAHLAMNYWPDRVREKCRTDKSLAIAHGLEELYEAPPKQPKKARGRKNA